MVIKWEKDTLRPSLEEFDAKAKRAILMVFQYWGVKGTTEMRNGAKWVDRTGNARNGLQAIGTGAGGDARFSEGRFVLHFVHSMPYGVWLEIRWSGRYAIIGPTMASVAPRLAAMVAQVVLDAGKG